ncbi:MAG: hypothetical protein Devi2KO_13940 [Devosia indica]
MEAQMAFGIAMYYGAGIDHFGEEQAMARQQTMEEAAMPIRPIHHRRHRESAGPFQGGRTV